MKKSYIVGFALSLGLMAGCGKKQTATVEEAPAEAAPVEEAAAPAPAQAQAAEAAPAEKLPGASRVRNDLKNKNYTGAVQGLLALRGFAQGHEAWAEYRELSGEVGLALAEAAPTNPQAAQALSVYRVAMYGR
jgi:hypothetical protein